MDEILYELRDHSVGLNSGRWDYIFSYVKTFHAHPDRLLPDWVQVGMAQYFMRSYSDLLIRTCHRRGVHAMSGMAAQIPIRDDPVANEARTMEGLRLNTRVGIQYLAAWLTGTGSVPLYNLLEDAATTEISRVQNWQWMKYGVVLDGDGVGVKVSLELFGRVVEDEMARIEKEIGCEKFIHGMYREACSIFTKQCTSPTLHDFLTLDAYNCIVVHHPKGDHTYLVVEMDRTLATYGINAVSTHLGCVVPFNTAEKKFICPCLGSQYNNQGKVVRGPAPLTSMTGMCCLFNGYKLISEQEKIHGGLDEGKMKYVPWIEADFKTDGAPW